MQVLVVGAGPSGACAALALARDGATVTLAERSAWPRDKTCGDGISPLALRELSRIGIEIEGDVRLPQAHVTTPRGRSFRGGWPPSTPYGTTIRRRSFDAALVEAAIRAGATFEPQTRATAIADDGRRVRATLEGQRGARSIDADVALIAEGATGGLAGKLGFGPHRYRLVTVRGYADSVRPIPHEYGLFYDRIVAPGYGWIFPMSDSRANAGILVNERTLVRQGGDARALLQQWLSESRAARDLLGVSASLDDVKGGVIPAGRLRTRGNIFLLGDAAGVADPFTAEGIYQSIASARLASDALRESPDVAAAGRRYERSCRAFDDNARAAMSIMRTFNGAIEIFAARSAHHRRLADRLNTAVFFPKRSFLSFVASVTAAYF